MCESQKTINIVSGVSTLCNYGYSVSNGCIWYYWHSFPFSYAWIGKE